MHILIIIIFLLPLTSYADLTVGSESLLYQHSNLSRIESLDSAIINPAGLASLAGKHVSSGATYVGYKTVKSELFKYDNLQVTPSFLGQSFKLFDKMGVAIFYGQPDGTEKRTTQHTNNASDINTQDLSDEYINVKSHILGAGFGYRQSENFHWGLAGYILRTSTSSNLTFHRYKFSEMFEERSNILTVFSDDEKKLALNIVSGLQYRLSKDYLLGLSISSKGLISRSELKSYSHEKIIITLPSDTLSTTEDNKESSGEGEDSIYHSISLGLSHYKGRWSYYLALNYTEGFSSKQYLNTKLTTQTTLVTSGVAESDLKIERKDENESISFSPVIKFALSMDYLTENDDIYVASILVPKRITNQDGDENLNLRVGVISKHRNYRTAFGLGYAFDQEQELKRDTFSFITSWSYEY